MTDTYGCDDCNKSSLSLFLLRPSPVAKLSELAVVDSHVVASDTDLTAGLLPARLPTESRFALRLLRAGYVHVYIAKPAKGAKNWLTYRVTDQADIVPDVNALFAQPTAKVTCDRKKLHNAMGLKLLNIPNAHKITELWIAFSANLWNDTLRDKNKANSAVMQKIVLKGGSPNTFKPTVATLKTKVLECALNRRIIGSSAEHDFAFNHVASLVDDLVKNLKGAAAGHPQTVNLELAVVLRDPVGIATELNELRLRRYDFARKEMEKPENAHPLNSSNILMGLKKSAVDDGIRRAESNLAPIITEKAFKAHYEKTKSGASTKALWVRLEKEEQEASKSPVPLGRLWTEKALERKEVQTEIFRDNYWKKIASEYSEKARKEWLDGFDKKMKKLHFNALEKYELDWWEACKDSQFKDYFALHFDEKDPNDPKKKFSSGLTYTAEVKNALTPNPNTRGVVCTQYAEQLNQDISQPGSLMLRAMGANQAEVLAKMKETLSIPYHLHENRNDKLYNLAAGMVTLAADSTKPNALKIAMVRYSWLAPLLGDLLGGYTLTISKCLYASVTMVMLRLGHAGFNARGGRAILGAMNGVLLIQRTADLALGSIVSRNVLKYPMQISKRYPLGEALHLLGVRGGLTKAQIGRGAQQGFLDLVLLTDNYEMKRFGGDFDKALAQGGGSVVLTRAPVASLLRGAATPRTIRISAVQFEEAFIDRIQVRSTLAAVVQEGFKDANTVVRSLEGRLAIGVIIINIAGLVTAVKNYNDSNTSELIKSWVGLLDTSSSIVAGSVQLIEYGIKASVVGRLGAEAVNRTASIHLLRASSQFLGAFSGAVCAVGQGVKSIDAFNEGYPEIAALYFISGTAFGGTTVTGGAAGVLALAERQVAKQTASIMMQRLVLRYGAAGAGALTGATLTGWGLAFLGAAVLFEVFAIVLTPSKTQEFVQCTYFGHGKGKRMKFRDWKSEHEALEELFKPPKVVPPKVMTDEEIARHKEMEPTIWAAM